MKLSVGCGKERLNNCVHVDIDREVKPDIVCDAENLPFVDNAFDGIAVNHCLEHLLNPLLALKEFKRVGQYLSVRVPNSEFAVSAWCEDGFHNYSWNARSLATLLKQVYGYVYVVPHTVQSNYKALFLSFLLGSNHEVVGVAM